MDPRSITVSAAANIALVKYWGKAGGPGNLPATGSLSIGLEDLRTSTTIALADDAQDLFDDGLDEAGRQRVITFLEQARVEFGQQVYFDIRTRNNFPTGSGLASSASGFAALAIGLDRLLGLGLSGADLSRLARRGSGSAARSIYGGWVEIVVDGEAHALPLAAADDWPLEVVVAVTTEAAKAIGSTEAMVRTAATSPYYAGWLETHGADMASARHALETRDFEQLARTAEHNCLKMHAAIMTSQPPVLYWLPATLAVMHEVRQMRGSGTPAFFSIDAGAQVKVICEPGSGAAVARRLAALPGVQRTISTRVGGAPMVSAA